jgi:uncharacterized membrane protein YeaQ/YmgE (transglycosylase-associated protein family)
LLVINNNCERTSNFRNAGYTYRGKPLDKSGVHDLIIKRKEQQMGIISWIVFGLIAGILAKWIMPGKDGGGFILTVVLGIIGAVVGGWISTLFGFGRVDGFNFGSFVVAVIGAIVVLFVYRKVRS